MQNSATSVYNRLKNLQQMILFLYTVFIYTIIKDKGTEKGKAHGLHRPNGERNMCIVWHDNGVAGQRGYTEYTNEEVVSRGGIDSIIHEYVEKEILVYSVDFIGGEK